MKKAWEDVKSFVTVVMTIGMLALLFIPFEINEKVLMLFSSTYGAVITYFFTKKPNSENTIENTIENKEEKEG